MSALAHLPVHHPAPQPPQPNPARQARLALLRRAAATARAMPDDDLFRACSVLGDERSPMAAERFAVALFQVLPAALGVTRLRCFEPGATDESFDEAWLLSALDAAARQDQTSLTFLLARRLPHHARRQVGFLVHNLSRHLDSRG